MSTFTIETRHLLELLDSLVSTASADPKDGAIAGVLLHTVRGPLGAEPGMTDLLVGTSCNRFVVGHTYVPAFGQLGGPVLWRIDDVKMVISAYQPKVKNSKDHAVEIRVEGGVVGISEAEDALFDADGLKLEFTVGRLAEYPRNAWTLLKRVSDAQILRDGLDLVQVLPRTDLGPAVLEPFVRVAKARKMPLELYRYHQRLPLLVQIGPSYRGAVATYKWDDDRPGGAGHAPDAEVYAPTLPPPPPGKAESNPLRDGAGLLVDTAGGAPGAIDEPLTDFPTLEPDPELLCQAAEVVVTAQMGSVSLVQRKLRLGHARASGLMEQLEARGVLGPFRGSRAREVFLRPDQLDDLLATIRDTSGATQ